MRTLHNTENSLKLAGHSAIQGWRQAMEDKFIIEDLTDMPNHAVCAVFDGHSGDCAAKYCSNHFVRILQSTVEWKEYKLKYTSNKKNVTASFLNDCNELISKAIVQTYIKLDQEYLKSILVPDRDIIVLEKLIVTETARNKFVGDNIHGSGCTAVCAIITPSHVIVGNCGDSRCIISNALTDGIDCDYNCISLTEDHHPCLKEESERIYAAGGKVFMERVDGELAMSRAIGDYR